jgi:thiol-disulfide isomerase/thioredoxin
MQARDASAKADGLAQESLMHLLRRSAADPAAARGLAYLALGENDTLRAEAADLLRRHHLAHPDTIALVENAWHAPHDWVEPLLRDLLATRLTPDDRRPRLRFALAMHLKMKAELPARIDGNPRQMEERYGKVRTAELRRADVAALEAEAVELFEDLAEEDVQTELVRGLTIGDASRSAAYEIKNLGVGKTAPDIAGEDLNGVPFKLSDYKGKVVMLSFWGSRCSPCMALVPHEREIAARYKGRPFALVGVCSDGDREQVKPVLERHRITWRSFWCGPQGMYGELPRAWNVTAWPTVYVIDHAGVIRSKTARGAELDRLLDGLVTKAEADARK